MRILLLIATFISTIARGGIPQTVSEISKDFDPRADDLETEVIREWTEESIKFRVVRYLVGTFRGAKSRVAAFHAYPLNAEEKLPGVLHMHGGGQRASLSQVKYYASRGYSSLSINWGGREMERAKTGDLNTDWGTVDPTQKNVPGYFNLLPGEKFANTIESPRNCNWYLLTLAGRRGITFLERQPEVDANRIGIQGHSMGGNLTIYVAGTDSRVKAASPSVGGSGFRTQSRNGLPPQIRKVTGSRELFYRTMGYENYAPLITAPVLHLGACNDFHGQMDDTYATGELIPNQNAVRYSFAPHHNHRFFPEQQIARPLWFDQHLKGSFRLPATPELHLSLETDTVPRVILRPDRSIPISRVHIYYSIDVDARSRFWRRAELESDGKSWTAILPIMNADHHLFAFANVYYRLAKPEFLPRNSSIDEVCLSSKFWSVAPKELKERRTLTTDQPTRIIDDFKHGWHDWYPINAGHKPLWQYWTRKVTDPKWRGPEGAKLALTLKMPDTNELIVVLKENTWRNYRGKAETYIALKEIHGEPEQQTVLFDLAEFKSSKGKSPKDWTQLDELGLCAKYELRPRGGERKSFGDGKWKGDLPKFVRLEWK